MKKEEKEARIYASRKATWQRTEKYYPSEQLKQDLNDYALQTGEYKSELAIRLLKAFFAERKKYKG
jgi:hypothetical protein